MKKLSGITPILNYNFDDITKLKRNLLLFDSVGVLDLKKFTEIIQQKHDHQCETRLVAEELIMLEEKQLIHDVELKGHATVKNEYATQENIKTFHDLLENSQRLFKSSDSSIEAKFDAFTRLQCFIMDIEDAPYKFEFIPIIKHLSLPDHLNLSKSDIVHLVIDKFPYPEETIPWEQLFDFKSDQDNIGRLAGLRVWINSLSKSNNSITEINDELEYKLYRYKKSLEAHKIKHKTGILETFIVGGAGLFENLLKLNFGKLAKGMFQAKQGQADILLAELNTPGHELGYIYKVDEKFRKK